MKYEGILVNRNIKDNALKNTILNAWWYKII